MNGNEAILMSGGVDSASIAYLRRPAFAFVIDYGQLAAEAEIAASAKLCKEIGIQLDVLKADCRCTGSGDMSNTKQISISPSPEWWPFRNQLLATIAASVAVKKGIDRLIFGSVRTDNFHVDGRAEFFSALNVLLSMQEGGVHVQAPALNMSSVDLVKESKIPVSMLGWTHSCHINNFACGTCRGCVKRAGVLQDCGLDICL